MPSSSSRAKFPGALYTLINIEDDSIIAWNENGDKFCIKDVQKFTQLLPKYFNTERYESFKRQINLYQFEKSSISNTFSHPHFRRGDEDSLTLVKRKQLTGEEDDRNYDPNNKQYLFNNREQKPVTYLPAVGHSSNHYQPFCSCCGSDPHKVVSVILDCKHIMCVDCWDVLSTRTKTFCCPECDILSIEPTRVILQ